MKILAAVVSGLILLGCAAWMHADPASWAVLSYRSRFGIASIGFSLAPANAAIWAGTQSHHSPNASFQLAACGRIWLIVQGALTTYSYSQRSTL
ncbi:MAG: hypothetical protein LBE62_15840 [Azonexus sp.]|jgi:hypothetical protein|nr:hypothetical protein [Azonexus sp.]